MGGSLQTRDVVSVHNPFDYEDYCWDTSGSSQINDQAAQDKLTSVLFPGPSHAAEAWPGLTASSGLNVLLFAPISGGCPTTGPEYATSDDYIKYRFVNNLNLPDYCWDHDPVTGAQTVPYNCVGTFNPTCSTVDCSAAAGGCVPGEHCHYKHRHVNLKDTTMTSITDVVIHTINHETGHVLGLLDPIPGAGVGSSAYWNQCKEAVLPGIQLLVDSIMHAPPSYCISPDCDHPVYYPCGTIVQWPRPLDRIAVSGIMEHLGETVFLQ